MLGYRNSLNRFKIHKNSALSGNSATRIEKSVFNNVKNSNASEVDLNDQKLRNESTYQNHKR